MPKNDKETMQQYNKRKGKMIRVKTNYVNWNENKTCRLCKEKEKTEAHTQQVQNDQPRKR